MAAKKDAEVREGTIVDEAPAEATETSRMWSGVVGAGDCNAGAVRQGAAEPVFIGDDTWLDLI